MFEHSLSCDDTIGKEGTVEEAGDKVPAAKSDVAFKEQFWSLQRIRNGKKSSLQKTYKTQSDANDKVWQLNENTEKALGFLGDVEAVNRDLCDMVKNFGGEFDQVAILTQKSVRGLAIVHWPLRLEKERTCGDSALALLDRIQREEDSPYESVAVDGKGREKKEKEKMGKGGCGKAGLALCEGGGGGCESEGLNAGTNDFSIGRFEKK